jgi:hypothetical protein
MDALTVSFAKLELRFAPVTFFGVFAYVSERCLLAVCMGTVSMLMQSEGSCSLMLDFRLTRMPFGCDDVAD